MRITPNWPRCPKFPPYLLLILLVGEPLPAQQPFTQTAPIYAVNSQYVQGVGPGYWPTAGSGLVLNLASGTSFCNNAPALYPGGSLTMTANATNYVYLDPMACIPTFNTSGYPPSAAPLASVLTSATAITAVNDQRTWFVAKNSASSMVNAGSFSGASVGAQIDNACGSLGGKSGVVAIPAALGAGQSLAGLANGCAVLDLRGAGNNLTSNFAPNQNGDENAFSIKFLFRERILSAQAPIPGLIGTGYFYQEGWTGGTNLTGNKSNYFALLAQTANRTPGQHGALMANAACFAAGDCEPAQVIAESYADESAGGDEGAVTFRGSILGGASEFSAAIASIGTNTINYSTAANENTRGEGRQLIDVTKADTRGNVTGISGTPAVVTATGTLFSTNHGGTGSKTSLCFELAGSAGAYNGGTNPFHDVYRVASVQSDTQLTLDLTYQGAQEPWFGDVTTGTPTLYPCSKVSSLGLSGSLVVSDGTVFSTGDSILEAMGHQQLQGMLLYGSSYLPTPINGSFATIENGTNRPWWGGLLFTGNWSNNVIYVGPNSGSGVNPPIYGIRFSAGNWNFGADMIDVADTGTNTYVRLIGVNRNGGSNAYFAYAKADDAYSFGGSAEVSPVTGQASFGTSIQPWQGWFQPVGTRSGLGVSLPSNSSATVFQADIAGIPALRINGTGSSNGSSWIINNGPTLTFYSDNQATVTATINAATGNAAFNNLPPVYNAAGTAQTGSKLHLVEDQVTLAAGSATVTLAGSSVFTSSSSYKCGASDQTNANAVKIAYTSGSQFSVTGTGSDVISFVCVGN